MAMSEATSRMFLGVGRLERRKAGCSLLSLHSSLTQLTSHTPLPPIELPVA